MANINGTANAEGLIGTINADLIKGLGGNDTLYGLGGHDTLDGGTGSDSLTGGAGNDTYIVDSTGDRVVELVNEGIDTVESTITYTLGNEVENLTLKGTSHINGTGNIRNNKISGNTANNTLKGLAGNDSIFGGAGNDQLFGGDSSDSLSGDAGNDYLLGEVGNDQLLGGDGNDTLLGSSSTAIGIIGDVDILTGGAGVDTFSFVTPNGSPAYIFDGDPDQGGYALITDFSLTQGDKIRLDGFASHYQLVGNAGRTDLFYIGPEQDKFELVAKIQGVNLNNAYLNTTSFQYV